MIFQAGFEHFLETIFTILIIWYLIRLISSTYAQSRNQRQQNEQTNISRKEDTEKHISPNAGEYVDYEEVKENEKKN